MVLKGNQEKNQNPHTHEVASNLAGRGLSKICPCDLCHQFKWIPKSRWPIWDRDMGDESDELYNSDSPKMIPKFPMPCRGNNNFHRASYVSLMHLCHGHNNHLLGVCRDGPQSCIRVFRQTLKGFALRESRFAYICL